MRLIQQGPRDAKVVIVGEAPGSTEARTGVPFSGGSGDILNRMLDRVGIRRDDCFITNICHKQPPENDFKYFLKTDKLSLLQGLVRLKEDINDISPNLIIALGAYPLRFLTDREGISKWRGSVLECTLAPGHKVLSTYHPAHILRSWDYKAVAELDLAKCARERAFKDIRRKKREMVLNPSREDLIRLVAELRDAEWLAEDIECFETDTGWKLACVGFADSESRAVVIPADERFKLDAIKELSECPAKKVMQNGTFDVTVLAENGITVQNFAWDTMLAHHSIYTECASGEDEMAALAGKKRKQAALAKGLAFLTSIYTDLPFYKDDGKLWKQTGDLRMFWSYNGLDCVSTREIRDRQAEDIEQLGVWHVFRHAMSLVQPLMACTRRGIKINVKLQGELREKYRLEIERMATALDIAAGGTINVKSPPQVQKLLYEKLGFKPQINRKTRRPTTDKDAISALAGKYNHPVLALIIGIRQHRDFIERYLDAKVDADGRMRCSFDITGTRTGRLSSRQSIYGSGTNLQNIPVRKPEGEGIRRCFEADEGKVLVNRDYKQAESVLVAYISGCKGLIELFEDPTRDLHRENAGRIFGKALIEVDDIERYLAKKVVHACNYGMEADRLVQVVNEDAAYTGIRIDRRTAASLIERYFMLYPEIREVFWKRVKDELRISRTLVSAAPFCRKRIFFARWDEKLERDAYAYIPQSTVGDLGAKAVAECYTCVEPQFEGAETLLNVHDSVMMQCWEKDVEGVANAMQRVMDIELSINGYTFRIPTDCKVGRNWATRPRPEEVEKGIRPPNPNGLIDLDKWLKERVA
jgi:uracil-DNA glycosylase family 4